MAAANNGFARAGAGVAAAARAGGFEAPPNNGLVRADGAAVGVAPPSKGFPRAGAGVGAAAGVAAGAEPPNSGFPRAAGGVAGPAWVLAAGETAAALTGRAVALAATDWSWATAVSTDSSTVKMLSFRNPLILKHSKATSLGRATTTRPSTRTIRFARERMARRDGLLKALTLARSRMINRRPGVSTIARRRSSNSTELAKSSLPATRTSSTLSIWVWENSMSGGGGNED